MSGRIAYRKCIKKYLPLVANILDEKMLKKGIIHFTTINNTYCLCIFLFLKLNSFKFDQFENLLKFILFSSFEKQFVVFQQKYTMSEKKIFSEKNLEDLKSKINANICIFHESNGCFYQIYKTQKLINSNCLKLVFKDDNIFSLIVRNFDLEKPYSTFCDKCLKSFSRKSILTHNCIFKKCLVCFKHKCFPDENYPKQRCRQCFKMTNSTQCFKTHKELNKAECKLTSQCHKCFKIFRGKVHECGKKFCKGCFSIHNDKFCSLNKITQPKTFYNHFICLTFSNQLYMIANIQNSSLCIFNKQKSRQTYYSICESADLKLENTITCFKLDLCHIMKQLKITGHRQKFFCDDNFFLYISRNIDSKFQFKKGQLTECVNTFGLFCKIECFMNIHPILIWHKIETNSFNPLFLIETSEMSTTKNCQSFNFDHFLKEIFHNDEELYTKIYRYKNKIQEIQHCSYFKFGIKNLTHRLCLYKIAFNTLKLIFINLAQSQKVMCKTNFQCLDFSSLTAIGKYFWDNSLLHQNLPILPCELDNSIYNSSKVEICFANAFIKTHRCHVKFIKSFISNDGQQFYIDNLSADIVSK